MSQQITFVSFAEDRWNDPWLSRQHLMTQFAQSCNVLFTAPAVTIDQSIQAFKTGRASLRPFKTQQSATLELYQPSHLFPSFYNSHSGLNKLSSALRMWELRRRLRAKNWDKHLVAYVWQPEFAHVFGKLGETLSVFHCHDYYPALRAAGPGGSPDTREQMRRVQQLESCLASADLVITAGSAIAERMRQHHEREYLVVENGVDYELLKAGLLAPCPPELQQIPRPLIGCIGRLNQKIDFPLVLDIARARPDWSLVLMGPVVSRLPAELQAAFDRFQAAPNCYYIPGKHWDQLPPYFAQLDVGLMPYRLEGTWMRYGFPLKFYEYMAVGKPMVSSRLLALEQYQPLVRLAEGVEQWIDQIGLSLEDRDSEQVDRRTEIAARNSWKKRSERIINIIRERIPAGIS